jgi:hypothetical protein
MPVGQTFDKDLAVLAQGNKLRLTFLDHFKEKFITSHGIIYESYLEKLNSVHKSGIFRIDTGRDILLQSSPLPIPLLTHTLLTKKGDGPLLSMNHQRWLKKTIKTLSPLCGWKHIVWVDDLVTSVRSEDLGDLAEVVEMRPIKDAGLRGYEDIHTLIEEGAYHHASVILRYAILEKMGGIFRGTDTEITQELTFFNKIFSFYTSMDSNTARMLCSGFLASALGHPVIKEALDIALMHHRTKPAYLSSPSDRLGDYYIGSGNGVLSVAFYKYAKEGRDMVFGPKVFNPLRPSSDIVSFDDMRFALTPETYSIHYCEGSWRK